MKAFIGGLAQHSTRDSLNAYFSQFGQADCVIMMDKASGRSRGFGFVDFQDAQVMQDTFYVLSGQCRIYWEQIPIVETRIKKIRFPADLF